MLCKMILHTKDGSAPSLLNDIASNRNVPIFLHYLPLLLVDIRLGVLQGPESSRDTALPAIDLLLSHLPFDDCSVRGR